MNTNPVNRASIQLFYSLVLALIIVLPNACSVQSKTNEPTATIPQNTPIAPTGNTFKCQSPDAAEKLQPQSEWTGSELNRAIVRRDVAAVKKLLQQKADPNEKDNYGNTPLINAVAGTAMTEPIEPGKSPDVARRKLQSEAEAQIEMVIELLKSGADANLRGALGTTPLIEAAFWSYTPEQSLKISTALVENKANVNFQNDLGNTALINAVRNGNAETVKLLIARGADAKLTNCNGQTALSIAESSRYDEAIRKNLIGILQGVK